MSITYLVDGIMVNSIMWRKLWLYNQRSQNIHILWQHNCITLIVTIFCLY